MAELVGYVSPEILVASSNVIGKVYRIVLGGYSGKEAGNIIISIVHPYSGSQIAAFLPVNEAHEVLTTNILGNYRGIYAIYKNKNNCYIYVKTAGADILHITSLSMNRISLEDVTNSVDISSMTAV